MIQAVIFDIDGTLLQSANQDDLLYRRAVTRVLGSVRLREELGDYTHVTDSGILTEILEDNDLPADAETQTSIKKEFLAATREYVMEFGPFKEFPGARRLISKLQASEQHLVAIATGGWQETARFKLLSAGFELDGVPLKTADDASDRAQIMQLALLSLGADPESITYYGDAAWDELACLRLGWSFRPVGPTLRGIETFEGEFAG